VTYLSTACAALVLVQATFPAEARTPPAGKLRIDELVDQIRYSTVANFRSAVDSVYRTVMNPRCQPWPLPSENYDSWRTLTFNFDSRDY
jgi:hypothetical protein